MLSCSFIKKLFIVFFIFSSVNTSSALAENIPFPFGSTIPSKRIPMLDMLLGIPYRNDGVISEKGLYTLFANENKIFDTAGLNCSGFVLEATRLLINKNISISEAKRDRLGDSGPTSPYGRDWNFGWNLILNISEGKERSFLLPGNKKIDPAKLSGLEARGYDLHAEGSFNELLARMQKGMVYLLSFNKKTNKKGYQLIHYHVAIMIKDDDDSIVMYQTTSQSAKSYKRIMTKESDRKDFLESFANTGNTKKYIAVIEMKL